MSHVHMLECISCVYNTWAECICENGLSLSKQEMVGRVPRESRKMESLRFLAVMLSTLLSATIGNL